MPWIIGTLMFLYGNVETSLYPNGKEKIKLDRIDYFVDYYMNAERKRGYLTERLDRIYSRMDSYLPVLEKYEKDFEKFNCKMNDLYLLIIAHEFVESEGNTRAVSHAGAIGSRQIMPNTARMYGLTVDKFVNEAYDPIKSLDVALQYILYYANKFNSIDYALMAYNYNPSKVAKLAETKEFWDVKKEDVPKEAYDFSPKIRAIEFILYNKDSEGIQPQGKMTKTEDYVVKKDDNLFSISKKFKTDVDTIRRSNILIDKNKVGAGHRLKIPIKS